MADPTADAGRRGALEIADRVVQRIAAHTARGVAGVVSSGSGLDQVLGHRYPKADATVAGDRARVDVEIAVAWPHPLGEVSAQVRDTVARRVQELVGLRVDAVDVRAATVVHEKSAPSRRVQ